MNLIAKAAASSVSEETAGTTRRVSAVEKIIPPVVLARRLRQDEREGAVLLKQRLLAVLRGDPDPLARLQLQAVALDQVEVRPLCGARWT